MIIYGKNPVFEAIKAGKATKIFIRKGAALYDVKFELPVQVMHKNEFDSRFHRDAQGVAAEVDDIVPIEFADALDLLDNGNSAVILDRIQDPQNFGAIIRSAHCFGVDNIIVPRYNQAPVTPVVVKASAGAIFYSSIIEVTNLSSAAADLKDMGYQVVACDIDTEIKISDYKNNGKKALIIGSEGRGIRDGLAQTADCLVTIPMCGKIDSLNAAQSAAIALYEIFK